MVQCFTSALAGWQLFVSMFKWDFVPWYFCLGLFQHNLTTFKKIMETFLRLCIHIQCSLLRRFGSMFHFRLYQGYNFMIFSRKKMAWFSFILKRFIWIRDCYLFTIRRPVALSLINNELYRSLHGWYTRSSEDRPDTYT